MTLIIGGVAQGKLNYVLEKTGYTASDVAYNPQDAETLPIFYGLEQWGELEEHSLILKNPTLIFICKEVGCGVVPVHPEERIWREKVGRLCCRLAKKASTVERIFCGIPMILKGDGIWI